MKSDTIPARVFPWSLAGLLASVVTLYAFQIAARETRPQGDVLRLTVTIALIAAVSLLILTIARRSHSLDEFERQLQGAALAFAFPMSLAAIFAVGFMAGEGVLRGADPRDLPAIMMVAYFAGIVLAWRKYR